MALPPGIAAKTVTIGIASFFDGTLADGTATITAPVNVIHTPSNRPIFSSVIAQRFVDGTASFNLAPTDAAGLNRVDWSYKLNVMIQGALVQPDPIYFTLPTAGPDTVDLDGLVTVPSSAGIPISVEVLTADELDPYTADFVNDPTSATSTALRAAFGRGGLEIAGVFTGLSDGPAPATTLTGQAATAYGANDATGRQPAIVGGKLTYADPTQTIGSYYQVHAESDVLYLSAGFTFTPWTTGGGLACLAVMSQDFVAYHRANNAVPKSPFHLTISPEGWGLSTVPTDGTSVQQRAGGLWIGGNLAADSTTVHRVTAVIDRSAAEAVIFLPDGTSTRVQHPDIALPGPYAFIEAFRDDVAGRTQAAFTDFVMDSRRADLIPTARQAAQAKKNFISVFPGTASNMTLNSTPSQVPGAQVDFTVPPSGSVFVDMEALVDQTADGPVHFGIFDEHDALVAVRTVSTKTSNGNRSKRLTYTRTDIGTKATVKMAAYLGGSAAASLLLGNDGSVYGSASISVDPLP